MVAPRRPGAPRIVAIGGGKGGVGKSTVAANLGVALARRGQRVVIVDADFGAANLHTMFGVLRPTATLADFFDRKVAVLDEIMVAVATPGVRLVPGTSRPGAANLAAADKARLVRTLGRLDADCVIVDVGAGTSHNVVDLIAVADLKLIVMTPQLPSLHNAYALLKACVHRLVRRLSTDETEQSLIDAALAQETKARTIAQLCEVLRPLDLELTQRIEEHLARFGGFIVANQVERPTDAMALGRMSSMIYDHLHVHAPVIATVRRARSLGGGLKAGANSMAMPGEDAFAGFSALADAVLDVDLHRLRGGGAFPHALPGWIARELDASAEG